MRNNLLSRSQAPFHRYSAYGVSIRSDIPLPLPKAPSRTLFEIQIRERSTPIRTSIRRKIKLQHNPFSAFDVGSLSEGSSYVGFQDVGECLVSRDGRLITCYRLPQANPDSFNVYLLSQALSFALVKNGIEPLHATAVVVKGTAIAFLGDCGFGKSTLAAEFLQAGHRLVTDDLLILRKNEWQILAYPGPPRIKLLPEMTSRFLGAAKRTFPMNPQTQKLIVPLGRDRACRVAIPFAAFYVLPSPNVIPVACNVRIRTLNRKEAFLRLLGGAFNTSIRHPRRLRRQFEATEALANAIVVKELSYPRELEILPQVREAILSDLITNPGEASPCVA
jgi:hypothetical protein